MMSSIFASILFGIIGIWMLKEGRRRTHYPTIFIAIALMLYPYFVDGPMLTWGIGFLLCGLAYVVKEK